jgi:hypothetical protein
VAPRGRKAAHTEDKAVTRAVFHAPMFALNADALENACEPKPHAVHADRKGSHGSAQMRGNPNPHPRVRASPNAARARVCGARIGDPILRVALRMDTATCIYCVYQNQICVSVRECSHRVGLMERERRTRAQAVQSHSVDTRTRAHARSSAASYHTRSHMQIYFPSSRINPIRVCSTDGPIQTERPSHSHMDHTARHGLA